MAPKEEVAVCAVPPQESSLAHTKTLSSKKERWERGSLLSAELGSARKPDQAKDSKILARVNRDSIRKVVETRPTTQPLKTKSLPGPVSRALQQQL